MPLASARARKLSRHWSKPAGAAANAAIGCASRAPAPRRRSQQCPPCRCFQKNQAVSLDQSSGAGRGAAKSLPPAGTRHPAADLRQFWTTGAETGRFTLNPAISRRRSRALTRRGICRAASRRGASSSGGCLSLDPDGAAGSRSCCGDMRISSRCCLPGCWNG